MLTGIDVSSYQAGIDLTLVPGDAVVIKATEGKGYRNPAMAAQLASAKVAGKLVGLYHFVSAGNPVEAEAANYLDTVKPYDGFVPILDFEPADRSRTGFARDWLALVEAALGVRPWVYMDASTALSQDWTAIKSTTPLWVAAYPSSARVDGYNPPGTKTVPGWRTVGWQYTEQGYLPGWAGRLDLNVWYLTRDEWARHTVRRALPSAPIVDNPPPVHTPWPIGPVSTKPVLVHGVRGCSCIRDSLPAVEAALRAVGGVKQDLSGLITQGAYSTSVAASAGTHDGGGCWDVNVSTVDTPDKLRAWRAHGVAMWRRTTAQGFPPHGHGVWIGCPHLAIGAAKQVAAYALGRNGLASGGIDDGPRVPYITWQDALKATPTTTPSSPGGPLMALTDAQQTALYNRIMGGIPAGSAEGRVMPDGVTPARVLDSADGDYLRQLVETRPTLTIDYDRLADSIVRRVMTGGQQ